MRPPADRYARRDAPTARPVRRHRRRPAGRDRARRAGAPRQPAADQGPRLPATTERDAFRLRGLLPDRVLTIEEQVELELEHLRRKDDALERYIGLAALQDRNATLFYRLLAEHLDGVPADRLHADRRAGLPGVQPHHPADPRDLDHARRTATGSRQLLRQGPYEDVRLIVVTDNERILGLGDQGAGGMAIPIGKLALYTAACGIHPALTLPVSLDVGTDNPDAAGRPAVPRPSRPAPARRRRTTRWSRRSSSASPRSGRAASSSGRTSSRTTRCGILDRYRDRVPSFNDDIQGTAAVVVGGRPGGAARDRDDPRRRRGSCWSAPGAAGIGIARLLRLAMLDAGMCGGRRRERAIVLVDSHGLVHDGRDGPRRDQARAGAAGRGLRRLRLHDRVPDLRRDDRAGPADRPGRHDRGRRHVHRAASSGRWPRAPQRPIVLPLSNPTSAAEATPGRHPALDRRAGDRRDRARRSTRSSVDGRPARDRPGQQRLHLPGPRPRRHRGRGARPSPTGCSCSPPGRWPTRSSPTSAWRAGRSTRRSTTCGPCRARSRSPSRARPSTPGWRAMAPPATPTSRRSSTGRCGGRPTSLHAGPAAERRRVSET